MLPQPATAALLPPSAPPFSRLRHASGDASAPPEGVPDVSAPGRSTPCPRAPGSRAADLALLSHASWFAAPRAAQQPAVAAV